MAVNSFLQDTFNPPIKQENCLCSFLESIIFPTLNSSNYQFKVIILHISKGLNVYTISYYERM